jgi:hypothetical protein
MEIGRQSKYLGKRVRLFLNSGDKEFNGVVSTVSAEGIELHLDRSSSLSRYRMTVDLANKLYGHEIDLFIPWGSIQMMVEFDGRIPNGLEK